MKKKLLALMMVLAITLSFTPSLALPVAGDDTVPQETELQVEKTENITDAANDQKQQPAIEEEKADENAAQTEGQETTAPAVDGNTATVDLEGKGTQLAEAPEGAETLGNVVVMGDNSTYVGTTYGISMTITPANGGTVTVNTENTPSGMNRTVTTNTVNLSATPNSGYEFVQWLIFYNNSSGPIEIKESSCTYIFNDQYPWVSITAEFKSSNTHSVNFDMGGHYATPGSRTVADGDKLAFDSMTPALYTKATDGSGLELNGWMTEAPSTNSTYHDLCYDTGYNPPGKRWDFKGTSITKDTTLYTSWDGVLQLYTFDLSKNQSGTGGKVKSSSVYNTVNDYSASCGNTVIANTNATAYAQPNNGYTFAGWSTTTSKADIVSNAEEYTFLFERKTTLYALFEEEQPTTLMLQYNDSQISSMKVNGTEWSAADKQDGRTINAGTAVTIEAQAKDGYLINESGSSKVSFSPAITGAQVSAWSNKLDGSATISFNMPSTVETVTIPTVEAGTLTYISNGGVEGSLWEKNHIQRIPKTMVLIVKSEETKDFVTAAEGKVFDGIEVTQNEQTQKYNPGTSAELRLLNGNVDVKYLWKDKPVKLTLHWSSIDGKDLMDPIVIDNIDKGTTYEDAVKTKGFSSWKDALFTSDGYKDTTYRTPNPITSYNNWTEIVNADISKDAQINADTEVYVIMNKLIDKADVTIEAPVCGKTGNPNTPSASVAAGSNYKVGSTIWVTSATESAAAFDGTFVGEQNYYAKVQLEPNFGYAFSIDPALQVKINGKAADYKTASGVLAVAIGSVTAVHDWGDWEVTTEPTTTAVGIATRNCKVTDCTGKETREIPKVTYTCTEGNNSKWTLGNTGALGFRFVRSYKDAESFEKHFTGKVKVDGTELMPSDYTALDGSVRILLKDSFLNTLAEGEHTVTVVYDDAEPSAKFSVVTSSASDEDGDDSSKSKSKGVQTGDSADITYLITMMLFGLSGIAFILARRREER